MNEIIKINGKYYFLSGWNGEKWCDCWHCNKWGIALDDKKYEIAEIVKGVGEADEDGLFDEYETVGYEIVGVN